VISYKGSQSATTKQSAAGQVFSYSYDTSAGPTTGQNVDAARVNTFFLSNTIHDVRHPLVLTISIYTKRHPRLTIVMGSPRRPSTSRMIIKAKAAPKMTASLSRSKILEELTTVSS
jgi:hypothetical protein